MDKEKLLAMGLTEEQVKSILTLLDEGFVAKTNFNEVSEENKTLKQTISERDKQLEDLKKSSGDNEKLKNQLIELQKLNAEQQEKHNAEMSQLKLDNAIETALAAVGAKNSKAVRSLFDISKLKLAEDGSVEGLKEQIATVQKSDPYMFNEQQPTKPAFKGFQPGASSDVKPGAEIDFSKMTYSEMTAYLSKNPNAKIQ